MQRHRAVMHQVTKYAPRKRWGFVAPALASVMLVAGCINAPELDDVEPKDLAQTRYPRLIPLDPIVAQTGTPVADATAEESALAARVAALNARAAELSANPVIDATTKQRLDDAVSQDP